MFDGFDLAHTDVPGATLRVRTGGSGSPVLLLHGHPRTHATWHRVAPLLAENHFVVCPDLRGYGQSSKPEAQPDHSGYSKRVMASDCVALMKQLGHKSFAVVGHDRGSYVAFRMALDHPRSITHLAVVECVPIGDILARCDARFAQAWWHWFFFAQSEKPERAILADPNAWYRGSPSAMGEEAYADYRAAIHDPQTIPAMMEDYRAGLGIDRSHDEEDRAFGKQILCPTLVAWALRDDLIDLFGDIMPTWKNWAPQAEGLGIDSGHHIAEDAPEPLARAILSLLQR